MSSEATPGAVIPPGAAFVASTEGGEFYWVGSTDWFSIPPLDRIWFPTAEAARAAGYTEASESFDRLEEFELLEEVGRGGTSIVYRARDRSLGRDVAIKVIQAVYQDDPESIARFAHEARLLASLRHPNIVSAFAVKQLRSGGLALVMEYIRGRTLRDVLRFGSCSVAETERVVRELASGLAAAHRAGIVHRDVKPDNVFIEEATGRTLLADFGIATHLDSPSGLTMMGTALGTPNYMSPEQIDGRSLDGRSDIYSLGLIAWEMLSGVKPWGDERLYSVIYKQKNEALPSLRGTRPDAPVRLLFAIETALAKDPEERWRDADELIAALDDDTLATRLKRWASVAGGRHSRAGGEEPESQRDRRQEEARTIRFDRLVHAESGAEEMVEVEAGPKPAAGWRRSTAAAVLVAFVALLAFGLRQPIRALELAGSDQSSVLRPGGMVTDESRVGMSELAWAATPSAPSSPDATPLGASEADSLDAVADTISDGALVDPAEVPPAEAESIVPEEVAPPPVLDVLRSRSRIAAGGMHTCGIEGDGALVCWGGNDARQLGESGGSRTSPFLLTSVGNVRAVEAGAFHTCALDTDGTATCWGENADGQLGTRGGSGAPAAISGRRFYSVTLGSAHTCGMATDGRGYCWGSNTFGQLGDGTRTSRPGARAIEGDLAVLAAGWNHTCALDRQGQALCWGRNQAGQLGDGSTSDRTTPVRVRAAGPFRLLAAGSAHTCALTLEGQAYCWGDNTDGRLGDGTSGRRTTPVPVVGDLRFTEISAGSRHTCAITSSGAAFCWGYNNYGQLGVGDVNSRATPTRVQTDLAFTSIRSSGAHTCGTARDGATYCWGYNVEGQIGDGTTAHRTVPHRVERPRAAAP